ncbi:MAG: hypothetical protein VX475_20265, partial [Myxococcota bacterium]|nr:hypothetical protein [Myxococcota bacterium]
MNTLHSPRFFVSSLLFGVILMLQGCSASDENLPTAREGDACAQEGSSRPGLVCTGGVWASPDALPDDMGDVQDMRAGNNQTTPSTSDMNTPADMSGAPD